MFTCRKERELEGVNAFYIQKEAEVCCLPDPGTAFDSWWTSSASV